MQDPEALCDRVPGNDQLIVTAQHGGRYLLCLDYRAAQKPAVLQGIVLNPKVKRTTPDFIAHFAGLRRGQGDD